MIHRRFILATVAVIVAAGSPARSVTTAQFELRSGADLLALCSVGARDPLEREAVHMCQGFAVGVYDTILAATARDRTPLFCAPSPPPQRNETIARFVGWAKEQTKYQGDDAADFFGRFLIDAFRCPKADPRAGGTSK